MCEVWGREIFLLVDSGASISVLFETCLNKNEVINEKEKLKINGISGSTSTFGSCVIAFSLVQTKITH